VPGADVVGPGIFGARPGGAVTLAEIEGIFSSAGQLIMGTGSETAELLAPASTAGFVLASQGSGEDLAFQYPGLTFDAGNLGTDYDVTTSLAVFLTTASLGVGTWAVSLGLTATAGNAALEVTAALGTATGTLSGQLSTEIAPAGITGTEYAPGLLVLQAVVTVAGTLTFKAIGSAATPVIKATTPTSGLAGATGYTALRVA
jgi:hypothetical protein